MELQMKMSLYIIPLMESFMCITTHLKSKAVCGHASLVLYLQHTRAVIERVKYF